MDFRSACLLFDIVRLFFPASDRPIMVVCWLPRAPQLDRNQKFGARRERSKLVFPSYQAFGASRTRIDNGSDQVP
jgi:hypothetical protein